MPLVPVVSTTPPVAVGYKAVCSTESIWILDRNICHMPGIKARFLVRTINDPIIIAKGLPWFDVEIFADLSSNYLPECPTPVQICASENWLYTYSQLCVYLYKRESSWNQSPTHWHSIGRSMTVPPPVLSPSISLPPPSSHCDFTPAKKKLAPIAKMLFWTA